MKFDLVNNIIDCVQSNLKADMCFQKISIPAPWGAGFLPGFESGHPKCAIGMC